MTKVSTCNVRVLCGEVLMMNGIRK